MSEVDDVAVGLNTIRLCGRVRGEPQERLLPSGDSIQTVRLVIPRARTPMTKGSRQVSDWVVCTAWTGRMRSKVATWRAGDSVWVSGALRRRFVRGGTGMGGSAVEVEMMSAGLVPRAERAEAAS